MDRGALVEKYGELSTDLREITNEIVLNIFKDAAKVPLTAATWLLTWTGATGITLCAVKAKMLRTVKKASTLRGESLERYKNEMFVFPFPFSQEMAQQHEEPGPSSSLSGINETSPASPPVVLNSAVIPKRCSPQKRLNSVESKILSKERQLRALEKKLDCLKAKLEGQKHMNARYNIKSVKNRDERNTAMKAKLRKERNHYKMTASRNEEENQRLKKKLRDANELNVSQKKKIALQKRKFVRQLKSKISYSSARPKLPTCKYVCKERKGLENSNAARDSYGDEEETIVESKVNGEFTEAIRFCVMELAGLEVATGKIAPVMQTVGEACGVKFNHLPSRAACQRMVDDGHVLAKSFLRERILKRCKTFGVHKDGTQRKKVKILDTSIQTESGESFCLGWSSVASETGEAIANEAKEKLGELAKTASDEEECKRQMLEKLVYFMNDRAANEKKSSRLLEEWRADCLKKFGEVEIKKVHHLYCSAHVLLAFHTYVMKEVTKMKDYESSSYKHPIIVMLNDASNLFGPVGDHRGVRMQWEAYCMERKIKSLISTYKDNRFNALFEVAAQVYHHLEDFINILASLKSKNAKQTRLANALENKKMVDLIECLGLYFHKVTGPFWSMIIAKSTKFETLGTIIQKLTWSLQNCIEDPRFFFQKDSFSFLAFPTSSSETKQKLATSLNSHQKENIISIARGILTALQVQLGDFLEKGIYAEQESLQELPKLPLTNLVCERHFGHLDASQRRRPHSSLHHHSSVVLLKQTRRQMKSWFLTLPKSQRQNFFKRARLEGKRLREKHRQQDKKAILDSMPVLKNCTNLPELGVLMQGQLVAVACEDAWYPAVVEKESPAGANVTVSFAQLGKGIGVFRWPSGKDVHEVSRRSVLYEKLEVVPRAGGRLWLVQNAEEIQQRFKSV